MQDSVDVVARRFPGKWRFKPLTLWAQAWMKENLDGKATKTTRKAFIVDESIGDKAFRAMLDAGMIMREETW